MTDKQIVEKIKETLPTVQMLKKQVREQNAALLKKLFKKV